MSHILEKKIFKEIGPSYNTQNNMVTNWKIKILKATEKVEITHYKL